MHKQHFTYLCLFSLTTGSAHADIRPYAQHFALGVGLGFATKILIQQKAAATYPVEFNNALNKHAFALKKHENLQAFLGLSAGALCYITASSQDANKMPFCVVLSLVGHYLGNEGWRAHNSYPVTTTGFSLGLTFTSLIQAYRAT